ncbi:MAG TPA: hypothetical protein VI197_05065 [Polyangiaceae bacterium]
MVAFVHNNQTVLTERVDIARAARQGLHRGQIDRTGLTGFGGADLPDVRVVEPEKGSQLNSPLVDKWASVDDDQRRRGSVGNESNGDDGLPDAGRQNEHTRLVRQQRLQCHRLQWCQRTPEGNLDGVAGCSLVDAPYHQTDFGREGEQL